MLGEKKYIVGLWPARASILTLSRQFILFFLIYLVPEILLPRQIFVGISLSPVYNNGGFSIKTIERALLIKLVAVGLNMPLISISIVCENSLPFPHCIL